jgi:hypothetical protein
MTNTVWFQWWINLATKDSGARLYGQSKAAPIAVPMFRLFLVLPFYVQSEFAMLVVLTNFSKSSQPQIIYHVCFNHAVSIFLIYYVQLVCQWCILVNMAVVAKAQTLQHVCCRCVLVISCCFFVPSCSCYFLLLRTCDRLFLFPCFQPIMQIFFCCFYSYHL